MAKTNKDLINELKVFSMKSEVEIQVDGVLVPIKEIKRHYIPEDKENKTSARNIVQIILASVPKPKAFQESSGGFLSVDREKALHDNWTEILRMKRPATVEASHGVSIVDTLKMTKATLESLNGDQAVIDLVMDQIKKFGG